MTTVPDDPLAPPAPLAAPAIESPLARERDGILSCLLATTRHLAAAADLADGLERLVEDLRPYLPFDNLAVLLLDDLGHDLTFAFAVGYPEEVTANWRFGLGQGIAGTVAQTGATLRIADVRHDRRAAACETTRAALAVPLTTKDRLVGVLDLGSTRPGAFSEEHERLLGFLSGHLAAAIDNARLHRNLLEHARTLSLLHELSREFASILDRYELVRRVAELLQRHIDHDLFSLLLWRPDEQILQPWLAMYRDRREAPEGASLALGEGICGTAAALRQAIRVPNVRLDPRYVDCGQRIDVRSELAVPLVLKDRLLGVVLLDSARYDAFRPWHEELLSTLASSIAIAFENAGLYEQLQREEERLQADLETAREIQSQLLPKASPWISGLQVAVAYQPARHLAGDFYDFLPYGDGKVAVAVGDVAGKSTSAALYGSLAIGMLREYAVQHRHGPARILGDMNDKLRQLKIGNRFLAMLFAVYDSGTRRLAVASSGLPYPYLLRGGELTEIPVGGVPLGLLAAQEYAEMDLQLAPGDAVVIFSDGVVETRDGEEREFGGEGVQATLLQLAGGSARDLAHGLFAASERFAPGGEPYDDRTVVALKLTAD